MSLLDEFTEEFVFMNETKELDGNGGFHTIWSEGVRFRMPQAHDTTIEAQKAEREGTAGSYTFLPAKNVQLNYRNVFKRVSDGTYFRVTSPSGESYTPPSSALNRTKIKAERWEPTSEL